MAGGKLDIGQAGKVGTAHSVGPFGVKRAKAIGDAPCLALGDKAGLGARGGIGHGIKTIVIHGCAPGAQTVDGKVSGDGDQPCHAPALGGIIATRPQPNPCVNFLQGILRLCAFPKDTQKDTHEFRGRITI